MMDTPIALHPDAKFLAGLPDPESVRKLEDLLLELPQTDLKTEHQFVDGFYIRTIHIPAGTVITGALSRVDNLCIVSGDITVTTDDAIERITGYKVIPAKAGTKRVGIAHADTVWSTVIRTNCTTVEEVEEEFTPEADRLQTRNSHLLEKR